MVNLRRRVLIFKNSESVLGDGGYREKEGHERGQCQMKMSKTPFVCCEVVKE